jgi:hypothetical protein
MPVNNSATLRRELHRQLEPSASFHVQAHVNAIQQQQGS